MIKLWHQPSMAVRFTSKMNTFKEGKTGREGCIWPPRENLVSKVNREREESVGGREEVVS